jgi:RNA polymerase sigma-70 factor, ECF subfamily
MKTKFNKSVIMKNAWKAFNSQDVKTDFMFGLCLKNAWQNARKSQKYNITDLYKKYYNELLFFVGGQIKNRQDAEEIVNDVFVRANENINSFDSEKSGINTWLYTIAKRLVIDHYRTDHSDHYISADSFIDAETGKEMFQVIDTHDSTKQIEHSELKDRIYLAINSLKPSYRQIVKLRFIDEYNYDEIAVKLAVPVGTVKGVICRCREQLKVQLQSVI